MSVFWNPCARAKLHQQERALKLCSATLKREETLTDDALVKTPYRLMKEVFLNANDTDIIDILVAISTLKGIEKKTAVSNFIHRKRMV